MPGWRGQLRAALALLLAPAIITLLVMLGVLSLAMGSDGELLSMAWEVYGRLLLFGLAGLLPSIAISMAPRQFRAGRLILWSAALSGLVAFGWLLSPLNPVNVPLGWLLFLESAIGVIIGLANAALFVIIAAAWNWPAARR
ncbi:MAG: hypothetical protein Q7U20_11315 [Caulobacter sp.]|nr:hypothetical protein [Caulobacter sp.]